MNPIIRFILDYDDLYLGMTIFVWVAFSVAIIWTQGYLGRRKLVAAIIGSIGVAAGLVAIFFAFFWFFLTLLNRIG